MLLAAALSEKQSGAVLNLDRAVPRAAIYGAHFHQLSHKERANNLFDYLSAMLQYHFGTKVFKFTHEHTLLMSAADASNLTSSLLLLHLRDAPGSSDPHDQKHREVPSGDIAAECPS